jgi:hypothetical protein
MTTTFACDVEHSLSIAWNAAQARGFRIVAVSETKRWIPIALYDLGTQVEWTVRAVKDGVEYVSVAKTIPAALEALA